MKKIGLLFLTALLSLTLPACNDDDGDYTYVYGLITTVHTLGAVIYFDLLEGIPDYDYNIRLYRAEEIYTGPSAIVTTQEELDRQGGDCAGFPAAYWQYFNLTPKWLTLYLLYPVTDNSKHTFSVIVNKVETPEQTEEGYLNLELHHSAGGDVPGYTQGYYVSFDLTPVAAELEGKKGVILGIETCENGTKPIKLDLPQEQ